MDRTGVRHANALPHSPVEANKPPGGCPHLGEPARFGGPTKDVDRSLVVEAGVAFEGSDGRTTMSIESHRASREELEQMIEMGAEQGMMEALGQVDAILAE